MNIKFLSDDAFEALALEYLESGDSPRDTAMYILEEVVADGFTHIQAGPALTYTVVRNKLEPLYKGRANDDSFAEY